MKALYLIVILAATCHAATISGDGFYSPSMENIRHANGTIYDQVALRGKKVTGKADSGEVLRISLIVPNDDIVQVEFSGPGELSVAIAGDPIYTKPARYNQDFMYTKGEIDITATGVTERTYICVFSVNTTNAINQSLFIPGMEYDGFADVRSVRIESIDQKLGGLLMANTRISGTTGAVGIIAPSIKTIQDPKSSIHDLVASGAGIPTLQFSQSGSVALRIAGGSLLQENGQTVSISGVGDLIPSDGVSSDGRWTPISPILATFATQEGKSTNPISGKKKARGDGGLFWPLESRVTPYEYISCAIWDPFTAPDDPKVSWQTQTSTCGDESGPWRVAAKYNLSPKEVVSEESTFLPDLINCSGYCLGVKQTIFVRKFPQEPKKEPIRTKVKRQAVLRPSNRSTPEEAISEARVLPTLGEMGAWTCVDPSGFAAGCDGVNAVHELLGDLNKHFPPIPGRRYLDVMDINRKGDWLVVTTDANSISSLAGLRFAKVSGKVVTEYASPPNGAYLPSGGLNDRGDVVIVWNSGESMHSFTTYYALSGSKSTIPLTSSVARSIRASSINNDRLFGGDFNTGRYVETAISGVAMQVPVINPWVADLDSNIFGTMPWFTGASLGVMESGDIALAESNWSSELWEVGILSHDKSSYTAIGLTRHDPTMNSTGEIWVDGHVGPEQTLGGTFIRPFGLWLASHSGSINNENVCAVLIRQNIPTSYEMIEVTITTSGELVTVRDSKEYHTPTNQIRVRIKPGESEVSVPIVSEVATRLTISNISAVYGGLPYPADSIYILGNPCFAVQSR